MQVTVLLECILTVLANEFKQYCKDTDCAVKSNSFFCGAIPFLLTQKNYQHSNLLNVKLLRKCNMIISYVLKTTEYTAGSSYTHDVNN